LETKSSVPSCNQLFPEYLVDLLSLYSHSSVVKVMVHTIASAVKVLCLLCGVQHPIFHVSKSGFNVLQELPSAAEQSDFSWI
jgi:hypothetical protein